MPGRHEDRDHSGIADYAEAHPYRAETDATATARSLTAAAASPVAWGLDAASKISLATVKAEGASFVCVYLAPGGTSSWKVRSLSDVHDYLAGGYSVVFNWEATGTPAGGWATGVSAAQQSQAQLNAYRGHCSACAAKVSVATPIYFNFADLESPNTTDLANATKGAASAVGLARTGGYGGYATIKWLFDQGLITWGWQTYAWSSGNRDPRAQLYQRLNTSTIDYDVAYATDYGQVPRPAAASLPTTTPGVSEVAVQNFPHLTGVGRLTLGCPVGPGTFTADAYVSLTVDQGHGSGHAYAQGTTAGVSDWEHPASELTVNTIPGQRDTNLSRRSARRVPAGTSVLVIDYDFSAAGADGGTVTLETK